VKCPRCQAKAPARSRFCPACGQALDDATVQSWDEARRRFQRGDYAGAEEALRPLAAGEGLEAARALAWRGHAAFFRGREAEAEACYRRALGLAPGLWEAAHQLGALAFAHGQFQQAADAFQAAAAAEDDLSQHPLGPLFGGRGRRARAQAALYLGLSLRELGQARAAEASLRQAIELEPGEPLAWGVLGDLLVAASQFDEAAASYREALKHVDDDQGLRSLRNDLGVALFRGGDLDGAAVAFKAVLKERPDDANALHNLGMLYLKQGLGEELRQDLREFLKADKADQLLLGLTRSLVEGARGQAAAAPEGTGIIGRSPVIRDVLDLVSRAARGDSNVLVLGPNGSGKELVARAIHALSLRAQGPFVAVNCAALPEALLESELFGYDKGAFTGAVAAKPGRFELASGGTLFLDEIGDLQPALQVKLLRAVQEKAFERLGGTRTLKPDFRLITATHRDLRKAVLEGRFREDLYYRLFVIPIQLPSLKERREDIPLLAEHFLARFNAREGKRIKGVSPEALKRLAGHDWPGNVRELENCLERAVAMTDGDWLEPKDFHFDAAASDPPPAPPPLGLAPSSAPVGGPWDPREEAERDIIVRQLKAQAGHVLRTAQSLGMSRATLYRKIEKYSLRNLNIEINSQI
jgi:DNA-binding NtrC family response regulator/thioredoxin-like negative regulator of GroEL